MSKVIVTDASERAALAVIRSLGKRGIQVVAADNTSLNVGFLSKYCSRRVRYPSPQKNRDEFVKSMLWLVRNESFDLLIPITDFTLIPIAEMKEDFEKYVKVAAPPYDILVKALDKAETIKIARECGVPCPKTAIIDDVKTIREIANELRYPVVIKPRTKVFWSQGRAIVLKVTQTNYANSIEDLITKYTKMSSQLRKLGVPHDFFLLQEFAGGQGYGVEALMHNGKLKSIFMHRRLREYPVTGGASTLRVSEWHKELVRYAVLLLKKMNWQGVAMVEFKMNEKNGDVKLMEVNGRFWGSLPLAIKAGVDFPYLLYRCMVEGENFSAPSYRLGVKQRWLIPGDILWLYSSIANKYRIISSVRDFLKSFAFPDDVMSSDDMAPTVGALLTCSILFMDVLRGRRTLAGETLSN